MTEVVRKFTYVRMTEEPTAKHNGWRLIGMPNFDPCFATHVVLHDTFEHHPDDKPDIEHEMMAFGATFLIRVRGKWVRPFWRGQEASSNASDIGRFLNQNNWVVKPCDYPIHDDIAEHSATIKKLILESFSEKGDSIIECVDNAMRWMSVGYVRALFRWKGAKPRRICEMLESVGHAIDSKESELAEHRGFFSYRMAHGSTLTVTFNPETLEAKIVMEAAKTA